MKHSDGRARRLEQLLATRFRFEELVASNSNASIYRVFNLPLQRREALKLLSEWSLADPDFASRFIQEAQLAASLVHPNIVQVFDFSENQGLFWYTMRLVDGPDLAGTLRVGGPMSASAVIRLTLPILDALAYSHDRGIVHRDIKPSNIILDASGLPHITDFGVAKAAASLHRTQTGQVLGTPAYLAPEQAQGRPVDGRTDLYALGVTLYELLTGCYPFSGVDAFQAVVMRLTVNPEPIIDKLPDLDPQFAAIIMRAIERDPDRRFPGATAMRAAIAALLGTTAEPSTENPEARALVLRWASDARWRSRSREDSWERASTEDLGKDARPRRGIPRRWWGAAAAVLVLAAGGIGGALVFRHPVQRQPSSPADRGLATVGTPPAALLPQAPSPAAVPSPPAVSGGEQAPQKGGATGRLRSRSASATPRSEAESLGRRAIRMPHLIERAEPALPEALAEVCRGEIVDLSVVIGEDGKVKNTKLLAAQRRECVDAAVEAVRRYRWEPALDSKERPLEATVAVAVQF
ncbi:MAG: protein kinase [Thermoanaerobaculales bacterium]